MELKAVMAAAVAPRTSFVTGLAWSFIGLSTLSLVVSAGQYMLFEHALPMAELREALLEAVKFRLLPPAVMTLFEHMGAIAVALFAASLLTLLVSVALLKRHNWARIAFAWIMIAAAAAHIAGAAMPFYFMQGFAPAADAMPPELRSVAVAVTTMLTTVSAAMGLIFGGLFAWVAKRLFDADIRQEFTDSMPP